MTGIFYTGPSPTEPSYVKVGDRVSLSKTLCQIEAMKMFNSVSLAGFNGNIEVYSPDKQHEIMRINQTNGAQVNTGDLLFVVRPR